MSDEKKFLESYEVREEIRKRSEALFAELKAYREREPLVQALLRVALTQDAVENYEELVDKRATAVRDFKIGGE